MRQAYHLDLRLWLKHLPPCPPPQIPAKYFEMNNGLENKICGYRTLPVAFTNLLGLTPAGA